MSPPSLTSAIMRLPLPREVLGDVRGFRMKGQMAGVAMSAAPGPEQGTIRTERSFRSLALNKGALRGEPKGTWHCLRGVKPEGPGQDRTCPDTLNRTGGAELKPQGGEPPLVS